MNDRRPYSLLQIRELGHGIQRVPTELGEVDAALTNPPAVEVLLAGAEGATFLAMVSRGWVLRIEVASCNLVRVAYELRQTTHSLQGDRVCPRQS